MQKIIAAGGLVLNESSDLLMIFRRGKWDLPKGKLDDGEELEECALREVKEETGLQQLALIKFTGITFHKYFNEYTNSEVIKETHWFKMLAPGKQPLTPQFEEDIELIEWVNEEVLEEKLNNSYPNITEIIEKLKKS